MESSVLVALLAVAVASAATWAVMRSAWREVAILGPQLVTLREQNVALAGAAEYLRSEKDNVKLSDPLRKAVDAYNSATATLESRVLVSARRFLDLKAAPVGVGIVSAEPLERVPRKLQAAELLPPPAPAIATNQTSADAAGSES